VILAWVTLRTERRPLPPTPPPVAVALPSPPAMENAAKPGDNATVSAPPGVDNMATPALPSTESAADTVGTGLLGRGGGRDRPPRRPFQLFLEATEQAWVMYSFDDGDPIDVTLYAGDQDQHPGEQTDHPEARQRGGRGGNAERRRLPPFGDGGRSGSSPSASDPSFLPLLSRIPRARHRPRGGRPTPDVLHPGRRASRDRREIRVRSRKRFGGTLQRYVLLDIAWTERPGRMAVLSSASVTVVLGIVEEWERVRHADHLLEIASELFPQAGPKPRAFEVLLRGCAPSRKGSRRRRPPERRSRILAIGGGARPGRVP